MYKKVHKKGNQWFRSDGTYIGKEVQQRETLTHLKRLYGNHIFVQSNDEYIVIYSGYYDDNGIFIHFCNKESCFRCTPETRDMFCYKRRRPSFYISE